MTDTMTDLADEAAEARASALAGRKARIADMRNLLDLLDADDSLLLPFGLDDDGGSVLFALWGSANPRDEMALLARTLPVARWDKSATGYSFEMTGEMEGGLKVALAASRSSVCERVVTTREVTETVPDPGALAKVPEIEVTRTVEDVTWECPTSILALAAGKSPVAVTA